LSAHLKLDDFNKKIHSMMNTAS